ncbi:MAG: outer membrane protein assembly factor BamD [Leptolyngbya sp. PLA3]|nr:MAG: outer membrane protein assembly factor BamD [Cyanobacteria bacterium CYA]MCE7967911.1 outer membrane protein assembly factor BamD [Leptolyngbya sp. PL-A3]
MRRWAAIGWCVLATGTGGLAFGQAEEFSLEGQGWTGEQVEGGDAVLSEARRLLASDRPGEALKILNQWMTLHKYTDNPDLPQGYLLRGDAKLALKDEYEALYDYEAIIKQFYGAPEFPKAVEREYEIAKMYLGGMNRRWFGLRIQGATSLGEELMIRVQERMPGSQLAEMAALDLGDYYYGKRDMRMAADMYGIFVANFPESQNRRYAALREIFANIASYKGPRYDQSGLTEAGVLIEDFQSRYPAEAEQAGVTVQLETWVDESSGDHLLDTARWYLKQGDEESARYTLRRLVRARPTSAAAAEAVKILEQRGLLDKAEQVERTGEEKVESDATP